MMIYIPREDVLLKIVNAEMNTNLYAVSMVLLIIVDVKLIVSVQLLIQILLDHVNVTVYL